jgi:hypothetical protein
MALAFRVRVRVIRPSLEAVAGKVLGGSLLASRAFAAKRNCASPTRGEALKGAVALWQSVIGFLEAQLRLGEASRVAWKRNCAL